MREKNEIERWFFPSKDLDHPVINTKTPKTSVRSNIVIKSYQGFNTTGYQHYPSSENGFSNQISLREFFLFLRHLTLSFIICGILVYGLGERFLKVKRIVFVPLDGQGDDEHNSCHTRFLNFETRTQSLRILALEV